MSESFKVVVAGSRDFRNYEFLKHKLDHALKKRIESGSKITIVSGTARGTDRLGERYAKERGFEIDSHPANWEKYGKSAGYIRNEEMAKESDALMAFWDSKSRGTKHMIDLAKKHGLSVIVVNYD